MVVFASQNVTKDPPFTKLDLLCCRNMLIYFGPELQKKLLPLFHYSLKADGMLFLGSSETIGQATDLFTPLNRKLKIFKRQPTKRAVHSVLDFSPAEEIVQIPQKEATQPLEPSKGVNTVKLLQAILSQSDMPACVIIDDSSNIIYIHGRAGRFLEPAEGETSINILKMAKPGLKAGLTSAIRKMTVERQEVIVKDLQVKENSGYITIDLIVRPLPDLQTGRCGLMMVIFDKGSPQEKKVVTSTKQMHKKKSDAVKKLEGELQHTRENLQITIEELETSNEELKSTNEELQSTNEELQSTNEEMETSKEELQSLNEESATVNSELQGRIDDLVFANDDIKNLLDATQIATLFLDIDLNIRRFTSIMTKIFPLTATDTGRPISHFSSSLKDVDLQQYAKQVLIDLDKQDAVVRDTVGTVYRMRLRPYRTVNNVIDGVVITFEDITELQQLLNKEKRLAAIVKDSNDAITLQDTMGNIIAWNNGAVKLYGFSEEEALKMNSNDLLPRPKEKVKKILLGARGEEEEEEVSVVTERQAKNGKIITVWLTVTKLFDEKKRLAYIASTERDLSKLSEVASQLLTGQDDDK